MLESDKDIQAVAAVGSPGSACYERIGGNFGRETSQLAGSRRGPLVERSASKDEGSCVAVSQPPFADRVLLHPHSHSLPDERKILFHGNQVGYADG